MYSRYLLDTRLGGPQSLKILCRQSNPGHPVCSQITCWQLHYMVSVYCRHFGIDNNIDRVRINSEGIDDKNINETVFIGLKICILLPINNYPVRCILTIFSYNQCCISLGGFNRLPWKRANVLLRLIEAYRCEISGSHGGEYEDSSVLAYCFVLSPCTRLTFQKRVLPPSSGPW
jgi:hypothetical protein